MAKNRALKIAAGVAVSFIALAAGVIFLRIARVVTFEMAMLMLVALVGFYVGFGILIAVYRFVCRLE
jgi:hypothetical protein